jgi:NADPH-dependent glutamate synthase beta subunit-like oxidoreductase
MHRLARQALLRRHLSTPCRVLSSAAPGSPWHVAIVGSGPAAFYTADFLLKGNADVHVDLYERLPVPFGLVRYGVAPDHQSVKNVTDRFTQIASDPRCTVSCNVRVGTGADPRAHAASIPMEDLREHYHAVVLACGADVDRRLGLPGEDLPGVHAARQFVEWYNGHPYSSTRGFNLAACETAVIVGHGNVALDCARLLTSTPDQLRGDTDVTAHAAAELAASGVRQVVLLGRRGVLHAAFTIKELRELSKRAGATMRLAAPVDAFNVAVLEAAAAERPRKRLVDLMRTLHDPDVPGAPSLPPPPATHPRSLRVQFQRVPVAFLGDGVSVDGGDAGGSGRLRAVRVQCTELDGSPSAGQRATAIPGSEYEMPCELSLRSVGYSSSAMDGVPFDADRRVVPSHAGGRVDGCEDVYVTGWFKRGPSGVILTNVDDARDTASALLADRADGGLERGGRGHAAVREILSAQPRPVLDFAAWLRIDAAERERGAAAEKVREKIVSIDELLEVGA